MAMSLVVGLAVTLWMSGIVGLFTKFEKLEMPMPYAVYNESTKSWAVKLTITNTGSADAQLVGVKLDGILCDSSGAWTHGSRIDPAPTQAINSGRSKSFTITIKEGDVIGTKKLIMGTTIYLTIQTTITDYVAAVDI